MSSHEPSKIVPVVIPGRALPKMSPSQMMDKAGYNPIEDLVNIAQELRRQYEEDCETEDGPSPNAYKLEIIKQRIAVSKELARFIAPQVKSMELATDSERQLVVKKITFSEYGGE